MIFDVNKQRGSPLLGWPARETHWRDINTEIYEHVRMEHLLFNSGLQ